jgi:RNA polymerase sporulation-specific sigma factor
MRAISDYLAALSQVELLKPDEEQLLWQQYKQAQSAESRARIIEAYQPLVFKLVMELGATEDQLDLIQEGTVGLIEAVETFNPQLGVHFATFAKHRVRGRLLNYLSSKLRFVPDAYERLQALQDQDQLSGQELVEKRELSHEVAQALSRLPSREQAVIRGVYFDEQRPQKVAQQMQISASYLYKLQKRAVRRLRGMLSGFIAEAKSG